MNSSAFANAVKRMLQSDARLFLRPLSLRSKTKFTDRGLHLGAISPSYGNNGLSRDVQRFLEEIGTDGKEARFWLKVFRHKDAYPGQAFAVLQVCSSVFKRPHMLNKLGSSLAFLQRNGLSCILVHGGNDDMFDSESLSEQAMQLCDVLESQGATTRPLINCSGVLKSDGSKDHLEVNASPLVWCLQSGNIPILSSLAQTEDGRIVHVCPIKATDTLAASFQPSKVMYLNSIGGLLNERGRIIEQMNMPVDYLSVSKEPWCDDKLFNRIESINNLLGKLPFTSSAVITSADTVLNELFTHKGSGTIFKKREALDIYKDYENIDVPRLVDLIERTFGKRLTNDYIEKIRNKLLAAYITESYSAAAIITTEEHMPVVPYLDKFAVSLQNQGLGAGDVLWERIKQDFPKLFWRSRGSNRINPWYFSRSEGSWTSNNYTVFWYGVNDPTISHEIVNFANKHPSSFEDLGKLKFVVTTNLMVNSQSLADPKPTLNRDFYFPNY
eukprot:gene17633-19387_t